MLTWAAESRDLHGAADRRGLDDIGPGCAVDGNRIGGRVAGRVDPRSTLTEVTSVPAESGRS